MLKSLTVAVLVLCSAVTTEASSKTPPQTMPGPVGVSSDAASNLSTPLHTLGKLAFQPNQLAANEWYRPSGQPINGHIEESFANEAYWPRLQQLLISRHGSLGIAAAEVGHISSGTLSRFRSSGLAIGVTMPVFTRCLSGEQIGQVEFFGRQSGPDIFSSVYRVNQGNDERFKPENKGWFYTRDGVSYTPDEIILDERMPNLLPKFDLATLMRDPSVPWEERKKAARRDSCPAADRFHPGVSRIDGLIDDYVEYYAEMRKRFKSPPAFSLHWNVNAGWEWRSEACLDRLAQNDPDPQKFERAYRLLEQPCHEDAATLSRLLDKLCHEAVCPHAVYLDMDLIYLTNYALDAISRDKKILRAHGVGFGIDLTDECVSRDHCVIEVAGGQRLKRDTESMLDADQAGQMSIMNKFEFLKRAGLIDGDTHIRVQSWSTRPVERGSQVSEDRPGSFANTALEVFSATSH